MIVCIVRHGKAERDSASGMDTDRQLAARGRRQAAYLGARLREHPARVPIVVSSPYARARRTAELIAEAVGARVEFDERLEVGHPASAAIELIAERGGAALCIVGHNPQLEELIAVLTAGPTGLCEHLRTGEASLCELNDPVQPVAGACELERIRLVE